MTATRKTAITIVIGAVAALLPPILVYAQGRAELRERYAHANAEADAGYKALVESVRELRMTVASQHDALVRLQAHVDVLELRGGTVPAFSSRPLLTSKHFRDLPANLDAAQAQR